jgi:hypothetical protein
VEHAAAGELSGHGEGSRIDPGACSQIAESRGGRPAAGCAGRSVRSAVGLGWPRRPGFSGLRRRGVSGQGDIRGLTRHCRASPLSIMGRRAWRGGGAVPFGRLAGGGTESSARNRLHRLSGERAAPPNKRMQLTKLSAAWLPEWTCRLMPAPARSDAGTASQLIRSVRPTCRVGEGVEIAGQPCS